MKYKIVNNNGFLKWENWKYFLKNISSFSENTNQYAIITINFNNSLNIINIIEYLSGENEKNKIDLIVIENSQKSEEKEKLIKYIENKKISNVPILETITNIGSAGAYALGLEYVYTKSYTNIFIFEDDVLLLEKNTFSEMINKSSEKNLIYINGPSNTGCEKS